MGILNWLLLYIEKQKRQTNKHPEKVTVLKMVAPMSSWPLKSLGSYKYLFYVPLVANALHSWRNGSSQQWSLHLLIICALRGLTHQMWFTFTSMLFLTRKRKVIKEGVDFKQIDKEWDWDNSLILQALVGAMALYFLPFLRDLPQWDMRGYTIALVIHISVSEPMFYWVHRGLHRDMPFDQYHSIHHSSPVPQPFTAGHGTPLESLLMCGVIGAPVLGACLMGHGSLGLVYGHILLFDFMRCMGYSNVEVFPPQLFKALPFLKYLINTPTYQSLHHLEKNSNYCLFLPLFDLLGGTLNTKSWELHKEITSGKDNQIPDFVFLAHVVDVTSSIHVPFMFRSFSSMPFATKLWHLPLLPPAFASMLLMWACSKTFLVTFYNLRGKLHQTWAVPRYGFQYFLPFAKEGINNQIELAILRADKMGIKVLSLAALNKNESLNGGGTLFVNKHPNLNVRVVHGNTLTAAVILNEIPTDVDEVFLTGATSKLGRAIALYLCRKKIRVLMMTLSTERFLKIQKEALPEYQHYLVQVSKYQAAESCKLWIAGKWLTPREQQWAPSGTHFHQFVVPPLIGFRRDCTYGNLAAMRLPQDVQGLGMCEYTMDRGVIHACHAGGVVHFLEGWNHHEVGAIDVDRIDVVWKAALKHGLTPV